ncbi:hypothetical protein RIF29_38964 [Crotalaria pallida]|uniref:Uncharacterized protein n=1 Tax=Crotalaria pallida TaxID=3830 RepID=A0AAN9E165_CROPI
MSLLRSLLSRRRRCFPSLLTTLHSSHRRPISSAPLHPTPQSQPNKKTLHTLFLEAVGLSDKTLPEPEPLPESLNSDLQKKLKQLEEEVRSTTLLNQETESVIPKKEKKEKRPLRNVNRALYAAFTNKPKRVAAVSVGDTKREVRVREVMVVKKLSPDMEMFVKHLFENGYFKDANFAKGKERFDLGWFDGFFARGYVKFAAQRFGRDNQEIAKWLSGSALKKVAEFGCPSVDRSSVFPAKRLRKFFEVPENTVCSKCPLQQSCKFINQSVWKGDTNKLDLVGVMKVLTSYALELVHPQLVVPEEVAYALWAGWCLLNRNFEENVMVRMYLI